MREVPEAALDLIREFEGLRLVAYQDIAGVWTIGTGHTRHVHEGDTCTLEIADAWLREDVREAVAAVERKISAPLTDNQFGALVSMVFNLGPVCLTATLQSMLWNRAYEQVPAWIMLWDHVTVHGEKVEVPGLKRRREAEAALWWK